MDFPCFLCCRRTLGNFLIQAASRREERKRLDESLSWVGVEWVGVTGWWLIGTQFWFPKQETAQLSPAALFANLVSIRECVRNGFNAEQREIFEDLIIGVQDKQACSWAITKLWKWRAWYMLAPSLQQLLLEISQHRKTKWTIEIRITMVEFEKFVFWKGNSTEPISMHQRQMNVDGCTASAVILWQLLRRALRGLMRKVST